MKYKVSELEGALLDAAVAKAEGWQWRIVESSPPFVWLVDGPDNDDDFHFSPSTKIGHGWPIIDRKRISLILHEDGSATAEVRVRYDSGEIMSSEGCGHGPTALIAAMRAYVESVFGDEIELPA